MQLLGANVRRYRKLKGMTQEELALEAGMERSYVSDLKRGTRNPSVRALGRIADALGVEAAALLERTAESEANRSLHIRWLLSRGYRGATNNARQA